MKNFDGLKPDFGWAVAVSPTTIGSVHVHVYSPKTHRRTMTFGIRISYSRSTLPPHHIFALALAPALAHPLTPHTFRIESTGKNVNHQQGMPLLRAAIRFYNAATTTAAVAAAVYMNFVYFTFQGVANGKTFIHLFYCQ